jgi:hypothetical protein
MTLREQDVRVTGFRAGLIGPSVRNLTHLPTGISIETKGDIAYAFECLEHEVAAHNRRRQEHTDQLTYNNGP